MNHLNKGQNRRDFIKNSALIGAVIAMNPFKFAEFNTISMGGWPVLKERITPIAIVQDATSLLIRESNLGHVITEALHEESNLTVCGTTFERGKKYFPEVLKSIKAAEWGREIRYQKTAVLCGWLIYRELPAVITPLYKKESSDKGSLYRDAEILKYKAEIQQGATRTEMEDILKLMWHRVASRMHTLTPDKKEWENWVIDFADWYHDDRKNMKKYAEILKNGNSSSWNEFVNKPGFFSEDDRLIKLANDFSHRSISLDHELLDGTGKSLYSKALSNGISAVKILDQYFKGNLTEKQLMRRLDIG